MKPTSADEAYLRQALRLGLRARGRTSPNPLVGCVIVREGRVLATGWHKQAGGDHAEAAALRKLGWRAPRATVYVTLEPHGFFGRTPPCTDRLIEAKVARVVVGMRDPNPRVAGAGIRQLRRAGIDVVSGVLEDECRAINRPYLKWTAEKRPWVTLKAAVTLDGRVAARGGDARWVSGELSRLEAHRMRDVADAILVGANTVRIDNPALTTRLPSGKGRDPRRVILDGRLTVPPDAQCLPGALVVAARDADAARERRLVRRGAEVLRLPGRRGRVELGALVDELGRREILVAAGRRRRPGARGLPRRRAGRRAGALRGAQADWRRRGAAHRRRRADQDGRGLAAGRGFDAPHRG